MLNHKLVLPQHINYYGYLFGGYLHQWVDEYSYITANLDFPGRRFATISLENVVFKKAIRIGSVLEFNRNLSRRGRTSVIYEVKIFSDSIKYGIMTPVFTNRITFVNVEEDGKKDHRGLGSHGVRTVRGDPAIIVKCIP